MFELKLPFLHSNRELQVSFLEDNFSINYFYSKKNIFIIICSKFVSNEWSYDLNEISLGSLNLDESSKEKIEIGSLLQNKNDLINQLFNDNDAIRNFILTSLNKILIIFTGEIILIFQQQIVNKFIFHDVIKLKVKMDHPIFQIKDSDNFLFIGDLTETQNLILAKFNYNSNSVDSSTISFLSSKECYFQGFKCANNKMLAFTVSQLILYDLEKIGDEFPTGIVIEVSGRCVSCWCCDECNYFAIQEEKNCKLTLFSFEPVVRRICDINLNSSETILNCFFTDSFMAVVKKSDCK